MAQSGSQTKHRATKDSQMKALLDLIIKGIVDSPDEVKIEQSSQGGEEVFSVKVAPVDMGKVIGRNGQIIKSIRTLLRTRAFKEGKKAQIVLEELEIKS